MPSSEERMMILRMVEEGKITPEEGARLLAALGEGQAEPQPADTAGDFSNSHATAGAAYSAAYSQTFAGGSEASTLNGRMLRVRVANAATGKQKVDINVPLSLVEFGLRFVPQNANAKFNAQAVRDAIASGMRGRIVDVMDNEKGDHVEVFIE